MRRLWHWLKRVFVRPEEDAYYAWADARLDELAEMAKRAKARRGH